MNYWPGKNWLEICFLRYPRGYSYYLCQLMAARLWLRITYGVYDFGKLTQNIYIYTEDSLDIYQTNYINRSRKLVFGIELNRVIFA